MAEPRVENSCKRWRAISSANLPKPCPPDCFEPRPEATCDEPIPENRHSKYRKSSQRIQSKSKSIIPIIQPIEEVVQKTDTESIETFDRFDNSYFDKIDTKALCAKCFDAQQANIKETPCSTKCRPLKTSLHLIELSKRSYPKATYKHAVRLDDETFVGRTFPIKIRLRRIKRTCMDCGRDLFFREPVTINTSVVVISDCCDITVYDKKYIENWHRVPLYIVSGPKGDHKKTILNEVCKFDPKPEPPPPPEVVHTPRVSHHHKGKMKK